MQVFTPHLISNSVDRIVLVLFIYWLNMEIIDVLGH